MTIEPLSVRFTIGTKAIPPKDDSRTVYDYRAAIKAKSGKILSYADAARRESAAAKNAWDRFSSNNAICNKQKVLERRLGWATILARISPVTAFTAADAMGVPRKHVSCRMTALEDSGFAKRVSRSPIVWEVKV